MLRDTLEGCQLWPWWALARILFRASVEQVYCKRESDISSEGNDYSQIKVTTLH